MLETLGRTGSLAARGPLGEAPAAGRSGSTRRDLRSASYEEGRAALAPRDLPDPELARDDKTKERETHPWKRMDGEVFVRGVRATDPVQGWLSDCYLAAALSAVAQRYPAAIRNGVRAKGGAGGGVYEVRFYRYEDGGYRAEWVAVDADFPWYVDKKTWAYLQSSDKGELWPALVEKAWAVFQAGGKGDYDTIGQGGYEGDVMEALTGRPYTDVSVTGAKADTLWKKIKAAARRRRAMTAGTYSVPEDKEDPRYGKAAGVYSDHAYTVMGAREVKKGKETVRLVKLRNPWGESEPDGNGPDDGIFELRLEDFMSKFEALTILDA